MIRSTLLISSLIFHSATALFSQHSCITTGDTIELGEVVVNGRASVRGAGFMKTSLDFDIAGRGNSTTLSTLISSASPVYVRSYTPGGIASLSFRGTGAAHTVVTWNGITLNNPMLGQSDASLLPLIAADQVTLYHGGSAVGAGHGGLGGVVEMATEPGWNSSNHLSVMTEAGSYGRISTGVVARYGSEKIRHTTRMGHYRAENNYKFSSKVLTGDLVRARVKNASANRDLFMQELFIRGQRSLSTARVWVQRSDRNLPVPENISPESHRERLEENTLRTVASHDRTAGRATWGLSAALNSGNMKYSDEVTGIISDTRYYKAIAKSSLLWQYGKGRSLKGGVVFENDIVQSENYSSDRSRYMASLSLISDYRISDRFDSNINMVLPLSDGDVITPDISAGVEYRPVRERDIYMSGNIAAKSRIPTTNDLYWIPGGNPDLKRERAVNSELSVAYEGSAAMFSWDMGCALYSNRITDMILWQPVNASLWSPRNVGKVHSRGFEVRAVVTAGESGRMLRAMLSSSRTISGTKENNEFLQTIYVPRNLAHFSLSGQYGRFSAKLMVNHTGKRYTDYDNSRYLRPHTITDIEIGYSAELLGGKTNLSLRAENVLNVNYQNVAYYPMPPASLMAALRWTVGER